jgi:hypothetical protein
MWPKNYMFPIPVGAYYIQGTEGQPTSGHVVTGLAFVVTFYWGPVHYAMGGACNRDIR